MPRLHFITTELDLYLDEVDQLTRDLQEALVKAGCPNDRVIILRQCAWSGSTVIEEPF